MKNSITSEATANQLCFNESPRWKQIYQNYEEYAVTSCKIEYIPSVMTTCGTTSVVLDDPTTITQTISSQQSYVKNHRCWEDLDQGYDDPIDADTAIVAPGFAIRNPNRRWKKYFVLRDLARSQNSPW